MSADKHKQIGIRQGATSFNTRTAYIRQNRNFTGVKGPIREKLKTLLLFLARAKTNPSNP
jgi:hypothetical protein